jgi:hypothetical protein
LIIGWMVGWVIVWLGYCVVGWLVGLLCGWLVGWMVGWLGYCVVGWMVGWLGFDSNFIQFLWMCIGVVLCTVDCLG